MFIAITETWLNDSVFDSEVEISGYTIHRFDHCDGRRGGGVAIYIMDSLKYTRRSDLEDSFEVIWIETRLHNVKYLFACVYKTPDKSLEIFDYMDDVLRCAIQDNYEVIIMGDLNSDKFNISLKQTETLSEFLMVNGLNQLIRKTTRETNNSKSLLDVLITSTPCLFEKTGVLSTALSDHYPIFGILYGKVTRPTKHCIITTRTWSESNINRPGGERGYGKPHFHVNPF